MLMLMIELFCERIRKRDAKSFGMLGEDAREVESGIWMNVTV